MKHWLLPSLLLISLMTACKKDEDKQEETATQLPCELHDSGAIKLTFTSNDSIGNIRVLFGGTPVNNTVYRKGQSFEVEHASTGPRSYTVDYEIFYSSPWGYFPTEKSKYVNIDVVRCKTTAQSVVLDGQ